MADYRADKDKRAARAKALHETRAEKYKKEIHASALNSKVYESRQVWAKTSGRTEFVFLNTDSVSALFQTVSGKTAVLNFASYKNPGGMYLQGSSAQEESLCMESDLFEVLSLFSESYYRKNRGTLNKGLYTNRALYTPGIVFERDTEIITADVITCASPNWSAARRNGAERGENSDALRSRVNFVRHIAEDNHVETIILGAYGCGVFRQDPYEVAAVMKQEFSNCGIKKAVFSVPGDDRNVSAFRKTFRKETEI